MLSSPSTYALPKVAQETAPASWETESIKLTAPTDFGELTVRVGGKSDGVPMVFWPSLLFDSSIWSHQFDRYKTTHKIILIDPPGIRASSPLRRTIGIEESAYCLKQILDHLNIDKCILVGCSWGSFISQVFAVSYPERLIAAIMINGTATPPGAAKSVFYNGIIHTLKKCRRMPEWLSPACINAFAGKTAKGGNPEFMTYMRRVLDEDPVSVAHAMRGVLVERKDLHPVAKKIKNLPVLVIGGEEDSVFPYVESQHLAASIANSRLVILPKTAHLAPRENPRAVNAEIDKFLAEI